MGCFQDPLQARGRGAIVLAKEVHHRLQLESLSKHVGFLRAAVSYGSVKP